MKDAIEGGAKAAETGVKAVGQGAKAVSGAANTANKTADVASDASSAAQKLPKSKNSVSNLSSEGNSSDSSALKNATSKRNSETLGKSTDNNAGKEDSAKDALEKSKENRGRKENKYTKAQDRLDDISDRIENSKEEVPDTEVGEDDAGSNFAKDTAKKAGNAAKTVASDAVGSAADVAGIAGGIASGNYVGAVFSGLSLLGRLAKYYILYFIVTLFVMIISIALIIYGVYGPLLEAMQKFDEIANRVTDTLEKGNNFYTGFGYQSTKDAFYEELEYLYNEYDKQLNVPLLMSTLFYTEMFNGYSSDFNVDLIGDDSGDISELEGPALKGAIVMYLETKYNDVYSTLDEDGKNYTVGKIYRLRKLARHQLDTSLFGSNLPTTSEEITLKDFVERSKSRLSDDAYQYLQTIASVTNPFINATNAIKGLYDMIKGTEICETTSICNPTENELAFQNLIKELVLTSSSVSSLRYSIADGVFYVTIYKYKANEDNYKKYLKEYYIPKMPEFKNYIGNATGTERDKIIDNIINSMYANMKDFADIFGYDLDADSEGYEDSCSGGIETELANSDKLGLPVKVADGVTPTFDGDYAFGLRDGKNHNGIDINAATTGSKEGDPVYAIADGEVIDSKPTVSCNSRKDQNCPTTGAWVRIKHTVTIEKNTYNFISVYMHMQANSGQPAVGTKVEKGQVIGHIGNTGDSSGPHLHFEFRKYNDISNSTPIDPVNLFIKCSSGGDWNLHKSSLSKSQFVSKMQEYCNNNSCNSGLKMFVEKAQIIYDASVSNNVNPEVIVTRAITEGFSPGGSTYNYYGIGCTNVGGNCKNYTSLEDGIKGFANLKIVKENNTVEEMLSNYAYIGDYWYNDPVYSHIQKRMINGSSAGGCYYFPYISQYMNGDRVVTVQQACDAAKCTSTDGTNCLSTIDDDQKAYVKYQLNQKMGKYRKDIFGIE